MCFWGTEMDVRPVNSASPAVRLENRGRFHQLVAFCLEAGIPSILLLPGVDQEGLEHVEAVRIAGKELTSFSQVARTAGLELVFESHIGSIFEGPADTLRFLRTYPELRLALDYSHFIARGYAEDEIEPLLPYVRHVHLRQAAQGMLQCRWNEGQIDFRRMLANLLALDYHGFATLEYEHHPWMDCDRLDVISETIKLRDLVWSEPGA
jgi:sugar phosphate isomerase/epimerase